MNVRLSFAVPDGTGRAVIADMLRYAADMITDPVQPVRAWPTETFHVPVTGNAVTLATYQEG